MDDEPQRPDLFTFQPFIYVCDFLNRQIAKSCPSIFESCSLNHLRK